MKYMYIPSDHQEPVTVIILYLSSVLFGMVKLVDLQTIAAVLTILVALKSLFSIKKFSDIKNLFKKKKK